MIRLLTATAALIAVAGAAGLGTWLLGLWDSDDARSARDRVTARVAALGGDDGRLDAELADDACERLAVRVDEIAAEVDSPQRLLRRMGREAAGIREGTAGLLDFAGGGRDLIPGGGFRARYDDGTPGQVRHFAGIAVAASYGGGRATRLISIYARRDPLDSPDGRLTERGIEFARRVLTGRIALERAGEWILERLCV